MGSHRSHGVHVRGRPVRAGRRKAPPAEGSEDVGSRCDLAHRARETTRRPRAHRVDGDGYGLTACRQEAVVARRSAGRSGHVILRSGRPRGHLDARTGTRNEQCVARAPAEVPAALQVRTALTDRPGDLGTVGSVRVRRSHGIGAGHAADAASAPVPLRGRAAVSAAMVQQTWRSCHRCPAARERGRPAEGGPDFLAAPGRGVPAARPQATKLDAARSSGATPSALLSVPSTVSSAKLTTPLPLPSASFQ